MICFDNGDDVDDRHSDNLIDEYDKACIYFHFEDGSLPAGLAARLPLHSRKVHNRLRGMFDCFCLFHLIFGKAPLPLPSQLMSKDRSGFGLPNPFFVFPSSFGSTPPS